MIIKIYNDTLIIYLAGDIDQHKVSSIRDDVDSSIKNNNVRNIIFDFEKVDFMDSSGIGMVLSRYKSMGELGGKLILTSVSENTMRLFDMVGIKKIIDIFSSVDEALLSI